MAIITVTDMLRIRGLDHRNWVVEKLHVPQTRDRAKLGRPTWRVEGYHGWIGDALRQVSRLAPALQLDWRGIGARIDEVTTRLAAAIEPDGADLTADLRIRRLDPGCLVVEQRHVAGRSGRGAHLVKSPGAIRWDVIGHHGRVEHAAGAATAVHLRLEDVEIGVDELVEHVEGIVDGMLEAVQRLTTNATATEPADKTAARPGPRGRGQRDRDGQRPPPC